MSAPTMLPLSVWQLESPIPVEMLLQKWKHDAELELRPGLGCFKETCFWNKPAVERETGVVKVASGPPASSLQ